MDVKLQKNLNVGNMKYILIRVKNECYVKINLCDIFYIKSDGDYCEIHLENKRYVYHSSLLEIINKLDDNFHRCHKSYIININKIDKIEDREIYLGSFKIPLPKDNKTELLSKLNVI